MVVDNILPVTLQAQMYSVNAWLVTIGRNGATAPTPIATSLRCATQTNALQRFTHLAQLRYSSSLDINLDTRCAHAQSKKEGGVCPPYTS